MQYMKFVVAEQTTEYYSQVLPPVTTYVLVQYIQKKIEGGAMRSLPGGCRIAFSISSVLLFIKANLVVCELPYSLV